MRAAVSLSNVDAFVLLRYYKVLTVKVVQKNQKSKKYCTCILETINKKEVNFAWRIACSVVFSMVVQQKAFCFSITTALISLRA